MIATRVSFEHFIACRPLPGLRDSSDLGVVAEHDGSLLLALIDGVGQGAAATEVAAAIGGVVRRMATRPVAEIFVAAHEGAVGTSGASLATIRISPALRLLEFAGIGRVYGAVTGPTEQVLTSEPGRLGVGLAKVPPVHDVRWTPGTIAVLAVDGLVDAWDLTPLWNAKEPTLERLVRRLAAVEGRLPEDASIVIARAR